MSRIPENDAIGVTVVLLTCSYRGLLGFVVLFVVFVVIRFVFCRSGVYSGGVFYK